MSETADWEALGLDPTDDAEAVKRAYRARLKVVGPDRDPEGFQRLRAAYEAVMTGLEAPRPPAAPEVDPDLTGRLLATVAAHRAAGNEAGAIAAIDAAMAAHPPGSPAAEAIEDALLGGIALDRVLSPGLFMAMVDRFDWRDANGRAAGTDAERHAILLDRVAAEEWIAGLRASADPLDQAMVATREEATRLVSGDLDAAGRNRVRTRFEELRQHAMFVLHRFDGGALARMREAVEGPPLLGDIQPEPAGGRAGGPWAVPPGTPADTATTTRRKIPLGTLILIGALAGLGAGVPALFRDSSPPLLDATEARRRLEAADQPWVLFHMEPGGTRVDFAPLVPLRRAIADLRIGVNVAEPATLMQMPENGAVPGFLAPAEMRFITMRLRFPDGSLSPIRRYDLPGKKS